MSVVFGWFKMSFWVREKVSYHFRKGDKTLGFREMDKKAQYIREYSSFPRITEQIKYFLAQPKLVTYKALKVPQIVQNSVYKHLRENGR